jgi:adenosyl cobinamide kinase/adenosyl cobinamide phosphate guanylyltransferase
MASSIPAYAATASAASPALRNRVKEHEIDARTRQGTTTEQSARIKALKNVYAG